MYHLTGQQIPPWQWLPDGRPCGRQMTIMRSSDFIHWSATKTLSFVRQGYRSSPSGHGEEAHEGAAIWHRGNVLLGVYGLWHGAARMEDRRMDLGLLISNDGIHFREPIPDFVLIPRGEDGTWDARGLVQGQGFENIGEETFVWYGNWDLSVLAPEPHCEVGVSDFPARRIWVLDSKEWWRAGVVRHLPNRASRTCPAFGQCGGTFGTSTPRV